MQRKELVQGLFHLDANLQGWKACKYGKQARIPLKQSTWSATKKLQPIHRDLVGPQRMDFTKESEYYILFIDDYTRIDVLDLFSQVQVRCRAKAANTVVFLLNRLPTKAVDEKYPFEA